RDDGDGAPRSPRAFGVEQPAHIAPGDVAHRDEQGTARLAGLEDRDDVRMIDGRGGPGFPDEPLPEGIVPGEFGCQYLQRDPAAQPDVACAVHDGHSALADLLSDLVAAD